MSNITEQEKALFDKLRQMTYEGNRNRILFVAAGVTAVNDLINDLIEDNSEASSSLSFEEVNQIRWKYIDELIDGVEKMSGDEIDQNLYAAQRILDED